MKITSTTKQKCNKYTATFDDGIILTLESNGDNWKVISQCSIGLNSYYCKYGKYPSGNNLKIRVDMATGTICARAERYKNEKD
jgi:hypothetical protein